MNTRTSPTEPRQVFINLAISIADCLEYPECPASLRDPLSEIASALIDHLSGETIAATLRALASKSQSGHTVTRAEPEKSLVAAQGAKLTG